MSVGQEKSLVFCVVAGSSVHNLENQNKMRIFCRTLRKIPSFQNDIFKNNSYKLQRANYSSDITPIKMAVNVFESKSTDPNASPLMIMHGLFGSKQNWRGISKALESKTKRKIYNVDARNHGDSPHVPEHNSACMSADIALLMQEENLKRISVMGHSMGGRTMMYFALKYPELVEKAIIVDISPVSIPKNFGLMEDIFFAMKNMKVSPDLPMADGRAIVERQMKEVVHDKETVDFIMLNLRKLKTGEFVWGPNVAALNANFSHFRAQTFDMPPFNGPVLFIGGKRSDFLDPADWPKIKELFPNAELEWLDAGHLVHFDQPAKFMDLVCNFLKS
ncbi:protein ABHD11 [Episyrphus balteatus]|uniref:protein ABHD11 n=1 Tax=Episyrphus balteatus TaxID=286459 RepID=UPI0024850A22|nr:protein ABHD11 [Episyrphus balteatus]